MALNVKVMCFLTRIVDELKLAQTGILKDVSYWRNARNYNTETKIRQHINVICLAWREEQWTMGTRNGLMTRCQRL